MEVVADGTEAMGVEELKAILEAKDGVLEEEEIIYATEESEEPEKSDEVVESEEIIEIIEEIEYVDGDEEILEEQTLVESVDDDAIESAEEIIQDEISEPKIMKHSDDHDNMNYNPHSQQQLQYDAEGDWTLEEDPLEIRATRASKIETRVDQKVNSISLNGSKGPTIRSDSGFKSVKSKASDYDSQDDNSPHEIVKNAENDLVYTVLGSKKHSESKQKVEDPHYIKMERLDEDTIPVEGTIYYEGDDMGTLYMAHSVNDSEQYQYDEQGDLEQIDQEELEQQVQWEGVNEEAMEQSEEEQNQEQQIFLHEDEDGHLYYKDESGALQQVYLTEDGNYSFIDQTEEEQDSQDIRKTAEAAMSIQDSDSSSVRQGSSAASEGLIDAENEDNTVTISLIISEDENGMKRTQVIIPTNDVLKCEICQKSFKTQFQLLRHNRLKHAREEDITTRNFPCDLCPKRFPDQNTLARHRKTHTGDRPFQCLECQETFPTAHALRRHMSLHNPDTKPLPCIYCGRRFLDKPALQKHEESHLAGEQQRAHTCDFCHKSFMTAADLSMHKKNHDPDKKFDCEVCGREFNRLNNLQRHMLVHQQSEEKVKQQGQNQEILACDVCGITYKFMSSLTRHMVTSHMNPEKLRQQAEEQRRKRENNYKRYLENRKMYETQHGTPFGAKRSYRNAMSSDPDDDDDLV